ncbi:isoleucine--tRNA ligase [bacterium]|nr:isoleucine--tRNA ligase [candidate division CSSED10-310 bacterium]
MFKKVEAWIDLIAMERRILKFWDEEKAFESLREKRAGGKPWSFQDGPITANNPMGVHHAWGRTLKDVYQRYHAMNGHELRYQNGFDCQGLWVEVEVEKALGFKNKRDIEAYGIENFIEKCKQRVLTFSKIQTDESVRLGYWMDWNNSYYTMSDENNYMIWLFLRKCHDRGLIYKGRDVMPWCARCGTGISQHEMQEGYEEVADDAVVIRFPLLDRENTSLLVWTTTPWTLSSNVAAAVHDELTYVEIERQGAVEILAEGRVEAVFGDSGYRILNRIKGHELLGLRYRGPYDELPAQDVARDVHRVVHWDEVSAGDGTGIVHIAPGCGKEDHDLGLSSGLPAIAPIDEMGVFDEGFGWLTGRQAGDVAHAVIDDLARKGILVKAEKYVHSYPHCWRCGKALLFRLVDEWYISMDEWRHEIMEIVNRITWIPSYGKDLELDWLRNMRDWMISKKRYWGLALPIWVCGSCGRFSVISGKEELRSRAAEGWEQFEGHSPHRPWIDRVKIRCDQCGGLASRIEDVGNPWLDAGIVPYSTMGYGSDRTYWNRWFPADLVLECFPGQFRNWFYSLLAMSTMMEGREPFKTLVGHALVRDEHGEEMHKSKGNAIWFSEAVEEMGADVMRWIFCSHDPLKNLNFGFSEGKDVRGKFFNRLWNVYAFFTNYARIVSFRPEAATAPINERSRLDRWILSNLQILIMNTRKSYEAYDAKSVSRHVEEFVDELSNWYIRLSRRRFWRGNDDADSRMAYQTLYECLDALVRIVAPIIPFLTEEMHQNLGRTIGPDAPVSVHHLDYPVVRGELVDQKLSDEMKVAMRLTSLALAARETAGIRVRQPLRTLYVIPGDALEAQIAREYTDMLITNVNVREVSVLEQGALLPMTFVLKPQFKKLGPRFGKRAKDIAALIATLDPAEVRTDLETSGKVKIQLEGDMIFLESGELEVESHAPDYLVTLVDGGSTLALDITMDPDLELEGLMRDLVRHLQVLRRDAGLEIEDHIRLIYAEPSERIAVIMERWADYLKEELLCDGIQAGEPGAGWSNLEVRGERMRVAISKAD